MFMNNAILQQERTLEKPTNLDDRDPTAHHRQIHPRFAPHFAVYLNNIFSLYNLGRNR